MKRDSYQKTKRMVIMAIFLAIIIIQTLVPILGFIPLGIMNATIIHVTVAIGAILLGWKEGAGLGFVFGLGSMWKNTFMPNPTSFCFSPFAPAIAGYTGGIRSVIVCFVPRILVGIVAALVFRAIRKTGKVKIALLVSGAMAAVTNTILVMSGIYFLFGEHYASATGRELTQLPIVIVGIIGTQGVAEAIVSSILTLAVAGTLLKISEER